MDRQEVIKTILEKITDKQIKELFPDCCIEEIRDIIDGKKKQHQNRKSQTCQLFSDGASRGNPGLAGAGAVLINDKGEEVDSISKFIGEQTNNVAEYQALIAGLDMSIANNCLKTDIFLDSELIVKQIQGLYKVKNEKLKPLFQAVQKRLAELSSYTINHVPRAKNKRADMLANIAIDNRLKDA